MKNRERRKYIFIFVFAVGVTIFISYTLSNFYKNIQKRVYSKQIEATKEVSMQGSAVVEKNLEGYINTLYGLSEYLEEEDIHNDANMDRLAEFIEKRDIAFQRIGVADARGNARVTNGEEINISDREYFNKCMQEKRGASEIRQSELVNKPICIIAVPILREDGTSIGVIYGVLETEVFSIYDNTILENEEQYIQLVDVDGNYILKEESSLIGKRDNIFDGINSVESQKSAEEILQLIQNEEQVYTEITDGSSHEIAYFTPLKLNDWCVVTVIDYSEVEKTANYILGNDTYFMILKVIGSSFLLFLLIVYYFWQDRKQIRAFNEMLVLDEKIVQIAAEKSGVMIMSYDVRSKELRFISNMILNKEFPRRVDNAPEKFMNYLPDDEDFKEQIKNVFVNMEQERGKREIPLSFVKDGRRTYLLLQLTTMYEKNGDIWKCIGILEDNTEEQELREKADRDPLTGLYNRSSAMEQIEACLKTSELQPETTHAYMIMDIDNFKMLNDTMGHQMGDRALQDVADILKHHFRNYDIICRLGGDEFLVFMKNIPEKTICRNAESLVKKLNLTYSEGQRSIHVTASVGIALVSDMSMDFQEMYRRADMALYQVKKEAKNSFRIYGKDLQGEASDD